MKPKISTQQNYKFNFLLPLFVLVFTLFSVVSCQKPLSDANLKYIGSWGSDNYSLEIWKDGRGVCEKKNLGPYECRVIIEYGEIKFRGNFRKTFAIDQDPYVDIDGSTVMILDGDTFYKH